MCETWNVTQSQSTTKSLLTAIYIELCIYTGQTEFQIEIRDRKTLRKTKDDKMSSELNLQGHQKRRRPKETWIREVL